MKNQILYTISDKILFVVIIIANVIFTQLPLINILSYESSTIDSILLSLLSGFYFLVYFEKRKTKTIIISITLFYLLPLLILTLSTIFCQQCPVDDGIYFYLVITFPSIIVGLSIACYSKIITNKYKYFVFLLFWLVLLLGFLPELYFYPQIYFFNPIFGYFPGVIYDHNIEISNSLIIYRTINLLIALLIIGIASKKHFNKKHKLFVITTLSILMLFQISFSSILGFNTTLLSVETTLNGKISTDNFNIIIPDTLSENQKRILELEHEYYYSSISKTLGYKTESKITSIIYGSGAQKKQLFGSANADVAKPWLNQIYLNFDNLENSLKHEIAHIFSAKYGFGPFKIPPNLNPGIIEGYAMAIENNYDGYDLDYLASLAYQYNYKVSLENLFTDFSFFSNASSLSYIYAGSFFKYLAKHYSWEKVSSVYSGISFQEAFNKTFAELEQNYYNFLNSYRIEDNEHIANYYFGRQPLVKLQCARVTAKALTEAQKLLKDEKYEEASNKYLEIYQYSNSYSALAGYSVSNLYLENEEIVIELLEKEIINLEGTTPYYYLEYLLADFYCLNKDSLNATKYYMSIIAKNPNIRYLRNASVKLGLLSVSNSNLISYIKSKSGKSIVLSKMILEDPNDYVIQLFVKIAHAEKENYSETIDLIKKAIVNRQYSAATYFEISNYAYQNLDFHSALAFGKEALILADFRKTEIIKEHISKLNWIISPNFSKQ